MEFTKLMSQFEFLIVERAHACGAEISEKYSKLVTQECGAYFVAPRKLGRCKLYMQSRGGVGDSNDVVFHVWDEEVSFEKWERKRVLSKQSQ